MQHRRLWMSMAVFLAATSSATVYAYSSDSVYSAAGELPGQRMARLAEERAEREAQRLSEQAAREQAQKRERLLASAPPLPRQPQASSAPPLPRQQASASQPPLPRQQAASAPQRQVASAAPLPAASAAPTASPAPAAARTPLVERDFLAATSDDVTIDVVDMPLENVLKSLAPNGWKLRFQRVGDEVLESSTDLTATNTTRGEVLHELLSRAGLAAEPFPEFDVPLLIVSRQGEL